MITVLLFAHLQEEAGQDRLEIDLDDMSIGEIKKELQQKFQLTQLEHVMAAINEEYALDDDKVKQGDVVAFIPPVSGG